MDNSYAIESFISYCDDMMIVTEGVKEGFEKLKAWLIKQFSKLLDLAQKLMTRLSFKGEKIEGGIKIDKIKGGDIKAALIKLISQCKSNLSKSKSLKAQNPELAEKLKNDVGVCNDMYISILANTDGWSRMEVASAEIGAPSPERTSGGIKIAQGHVTLGGGYYKKGMTIPT